ncbi:MAG: FapA family protein, partial [Sulfuricellaceae bacterium]|nr:FapA family protein [Sulfuricellaceae bacterium]
VARVRCGGSCSAHFIENASVETGGSILVDEFVMQSDLAAVNQILVGKPGSGKGRIIGGQVAATLLVQTAVIGSLAGVKTRIMVGMNPFLHEKLRNAAKHLEAEGGELAEVDKLLSFIAGHPGRLSPEVCDKARNTRQALVQKIQLALEEKSELSLQVELAAEAKVVVEKTVFNNVQIEIGGQIHWVELGRNSGTFFLAEEGIEFQ